MQFKDKTSLIGRVGILIPLILIFLTAADSAFACPGHKTGVAYRSKAVKTRTASYMPATVISYRAPASYRRCGANLYDTRGGKYVSVRSSGTRYVAVRADDVSRSFGRQRYGAVYDVDYGLARREARGTRYLAVRSAPRVKYVAVRNIEIDDDDDEPRYIAVRRVVPRTRYVAVRNVDIDDDDDEYIKLRRSAPRTKYVAVRHVDIDDDDEPRYVAVRNVAPRTRYVAVRSIDDGCTREVALRSCLDEIETKSVKHVVLRDDDDEVIDAKYVALRDESDDEEYVLKKDVDDDYIAVANSVPAHVEYRDASYSDLDTPVAMSTRTILYSTDDEDMDDQAFIDEDDTTYVAVADTEDACLTRQIVDTSPEYAPVAYVEADSEMENDAAYLETETLAAVPRPRYVAMDDDRVFNDLDPTWVDEVGPEVAAAFNYVPAEQVASYVPVEAVDEGVDTETVSYVPVNDMQTTEVSYVPVADVESDLDTDDVSYVAVADVDNVDVNYVAAEPVSVAGAPTVLVAEVDNDLVAELSSTRQIAGEFGYRDGFEDGQEAALEGDLYHPENSGDFKKATEGYEDDFGNKDVYKDGYRNSYLAGYRAGFQTGNAV